MKPLAAAEANDLAASRWGMGGDVKELPSYIDCNFRIRNDKGTFVLKIAHPSWSHVDLDLENRAMMALARQEPDVNWPRVMLTPEGEHLLAIPIDGEICHVRLLTFVPGQTWGDVIGDVPDGQRPALHESLGAIVGRLTHGLESFQHAAADRPHPWNLLALPALSPEVEKIDDPIRRQAVHTTLQTFLSQLPRWQATLPQCVIHNDANDFNVIVGHDDDRYEARSVIDFGDLCTSFRVANLAIACTYAMQHEADPVACARRMVKGYLDHAALTAEEISALQTLIGARICHSILMAARTHAEQPDNDYILVSQQGVQALLYKLLAAPADAIAQPFIESPDV